MSFIQAYNGVLNQGPSLSELAANAVMQATQRDDDKKITLSSDTKSKVHTQWIELKNFLENSSVLQLMLTCERDIAARLKTQESTNKIGIANHIEELWNTFNQKLNALSGPHVPSTSVGV